MSVRCFDLQVNGFKGVDFSASGLTMECVELVAEALQHAGTERFFPTVITSGLEVYERNLPILARACAKDSRIAGMHLEGPFISLEDGAVGAHPKSCVLAPSIEQFKRLQDWAEGHIRLVTLAPERAGALALIEYLVKNNVVVSVGHTLADSKHIEDACKAGATLATHLGNGVPNQLNRTNNTIWSILSSPLTVMLISDGFHLPPNFVKTVYAAKGAEKIIITSDAAPIAGCEPGEYEIFGTRVRLSEDGCVYNLNAPTLAGSGADLAQCAAVCKEILDVDENVLGQLCYDNASRLFG